MNENVKEFELEVRDWKTLTSIAGASEILGLDKHSSYRGLFRVVSRGKGLRAAYQVFIVANVDFNGNASKISSMVEEYSKALEDCKFEVRRYSLGIHDQGSGLVSQVSGWSELTSKEVATIKAIEAQMKLDKAKAKEISKAEKELKKLRGW